MIRHKDNTFEQWSICPATGDIFDVKTGETQPVKIHADGRPYFRKMLVHQIMAHTFLGGYKSGYDVHHKDENPLNNSLSNLVYLTKSEHSRLHAGELLHEERRLKISAANKGKTRSEETRLKLSASLKGKSKSEEVRLKMSESHKGKPHPYKGKPRSEETKAKISATMKDKTIEKKKH